jgi:hypothetical protein
MALEQTIKEKKKAATEDLRIQIAAMEKAVDEQYAGELTALTTQIKQTEAAWNKATHLDELEDEISELLLSEHHENDCWPDSDCRQCSYEVDESEVEEYLFEHAEDFEVEDKPDEEVATASA